MNITVIDIEASGFGRGSYPIEIGLAMADGSSRCLLIRPHEDWIHWDDEAETLHGISRDCLFQYGINIVEVAESLNKWLEGQMIYSDAWGNDGSWLSILFEYAERAMAFRLESLRSLLTEEQSELWHGIKDQVETDLAFNRHRASNDARILQQTFYRTRAYLEAPLPY